MAQWQLETCSFARDVCSVLRKTIVSPARNARVRLFPPAKLSKLPQQPCREDKLWTANAIGLRQLFLGLFEKVSDLIEALKSARVLWRTYRRVAAKAQKAVRVLLACKVRLQNGYVAQTERVF